MEAGGGGEGRGGGSWWWLVGKGWREVSIAEPLERSKLEDDLKYCIFIVLWTCILIVHDNSVSMTYFLNFHDDIVLLSYSP